MLRRFLSALLLGGALVAGACSSFSSAPGGTGDAGADSGPSGAVADAEVPDAANDCETVTFDLGASPVGAGWTNSFTDANGHIDRVDGGVRMSTDPGHRGALAALQYRVVHRETLSRVMLTARFANVTAATDNWTAASFVVRDGDLNSAGLQVQPLTNQSAVALYFPADAGPSTPILSAPIGSFPNGAPFDLVLTAAGPWSQGPTVSLVSNLFTAAAEPGPQLPAVPEPDDAGLPAVDVTLGILFAPSNGVSIELDDARIEICRH